MVLDELFLVSSLCGSILINLIRAKACCNGNPLVLWKKDIVNKFVTSIMFKL